MLCKTVLVIIGLILIAACVVIYVERRDRRHALEVLAGEDSHDELFQPLYEYLDNKYRIQHTTQIYNFNWRCGIIQLVTPKGHPKYKNHQYYTTEDMERFTGDLYGTGHRLAQSRNIDTHTFLSWWLNKFIEKDYPHLKLK